MRAESEVSCFTPTLTRPHQEGGRVLACRAAPISPPPLWVSEGGGQARRVQSFER